MTARDRWIDRHLRRLHLGQFLQRAVECVAVYLFFFGTTVLVVKLMVPALWPHVLWVATGEVPVTVGDVAAALDSTEHAKRVHEWAGDVWGQWSEHHESVRDLALKCHG